MTPEFADDYYRGIKPIKNFSGKIQRYELDFVLQRNSSSAPCLEQVVEDLEDTNNDPDDNISGGGSTGDVINGGGIDIGGNDGPGDGGFANCVIHVEVECPSTDRPIPPRFDNGGCEVVTYVINCVDNDSKSANRNLCDGTEDEVIVINPLNAITAIRLNLQIRTGTAEANWLSNTANYTKMTQIYLFGVRNNWSAEALTQIREMLEASIDGTAISLAPFVKIKYPINAETGESEGEDDYPLITSVLRDELPNMANDQFLVNALMEYGSLTEEQIKDALTWGKGPIIELGNTNPGWGKFSNGEDDSDTNIISLHWDLEEIFNVYPDVSKDALKFFIAITVLHELTHYGDYHYNGNMYISDSGDADAEGYDFDMEVIGETMQDPDTGGDLYQTYILRRRN